MDVKSALKKAYKAYKKFITSQQQLDTNFIEAVRDGKTDKVKKYLEDGANASASHGWSSETALSLSIGNKNREIFDIVIAAGADVDGKVGYHSSPLLVATMKSETEFAKALVAAKAKVNKAGDGGNTALHHAVAAGNTALADFLLENGAKADAPNSKGWTALTYAIRNGDLSTMQKLFSKGVRTDRLDQEGRGLLDIADDYDRPKAKRALLDYQDTLVPRWQLTEDADEVAHVSIMRDLGYRLTEVFNTRTSRQTVITHNFETGRDQTDVRALGEADKPALAEAQKQLAALKSATAETKKATAQPG